MSLAVRIASEFHQDVMRQIQWYLRQPMGRSREITQMPWMRRWNSWAAFRRRVRAAASSIPNSGICGSFASRDRLIAIRFFIAQARRN